jgi:hypothetical protein
MGLLAKASVAIDGSKFKAVIIAMPLVLVAQEPLRQKILSEFQQLIRFGFVDEATRSYLTGSGQVRSLLQTQIEQLDLPAKSLFRRFAEITFVTSFSWIRGSRCVSFVAGITMAYLQAEDDLFISLIW